MKNEKQEIDADTQSQKEGDDAESFDGENKNSSEDPPEDAAPVSEEEDIPGPPASEKEDSSCTPKFVPEKANAELATTSADILEEEVESATTEDNSSDEPDNEWYVYVVSP